MLIPLSSRQQRNLPVRGFRPAYYLIGMHMVMAYGFYKLYYGIREQKYVFNSDSARCLWSFW
jgi:hypothetical protein